MNKKQLIVLGAGVLVISMFILTAPKYVYIPREGTLLASEISSYNAKRYEQKISWNWVFQFSLPVILIGTFLVYLLRGNAEVNIPAPRPKTKNLLIRLFKSKKFKLIIASFGIAIILWIGGVIVIEWIREYY